MASQTIMEDLINISEDTKVMFCQRLCRDRSGRRSDLTTILG